MANNVLLEMVDPRKCIITLHRDRFEGHILSRHPGIQINWIQKTIEDPSFIVEDAQNDLREVYYKMGLFTDTKEWMRVVIERNTVVTAFKAFGGKQGERMIWTPKK